MFNKFWSDEDKRYGKRLGDSNTYTSGVIGQYNVVLVHLREMGNITTLVIVANLKLSFSEIKLVLIIGICNIVLFYEDGYNKH